MWPLERKAAPPVHNPATAAETASVLSLLLPDEVASLGGLPDNAVAAMVQGHTPSPGVAVPPENVQPNPAFVAFLHSVIRTRGPSDPGLRAAAAAQRAGWVYVVDLRTAGGPQGAVPPEDIIGGFKVEAGTIVVDSYAANTAHRVFTSHGLVRLPSSLRTAFVEELIRRNAPPTTEKFVPCCFHVRARHVRELSHVHGIDFDLFQCPQCGRYWVYGWSYQSQGCQEASVDAAAKMQSLDESELRAFMKDWV
jgi:hypothetical protein